MWLLAIAGVMVKGIAFEAVDKYFRLVSVRGYVPFDRVLKVMFLLMVDEFTDRFMDYMEEDDVHLIDGCLSDLYGSDCFISFPERANSIGLSGTPASGSLCARKRRKSSEKIKYIDGRFGSLEDVLAPYKEDEDEQL